MNMKFNVPYHPNPGNACALACYTMVAQYLLPEQHITFERLGDICHWRPGFVVWTFNAWEWLMNQGVQIINYDVIDYDAWAKDGIEGLRRSVPEQEFKFYKENTFDLEHESTQMRHMLDHPNFTYVRKQPSWEDLVTESRKPGICDLTLNSQFLNHEGGFALHRVVLIDINDTEVVFHDPNADGSGAYRREPLKHFRRAFESAEGRDIARFALCLRPQHAIQ